MGTISDCLHLKVNLKDKIYVYVNPKASKKIIKILRLFLFSTGVNDALLHLELRISPRIFEKILHGPNRILMGLGETDSWKNLTSKYRCTVPLIFFLTFFMRSHAETNQKVTNVFSVLSFHLLLHLNMIWMHCKGLYHIPSPPLTPLPPSPFPPPPPQCRPT
jgi:hypothetical protein